MNRFLVLIFAFLIGLQPAFSQSSSGFGWQGRSGGGGGGLTSPVGISDGGTGLTSFTGGDTLYYTSGTALSKLAKGTAGQIYQMNSGATAPQWSSFSGDITVAAGGAATIKSSVALAGSPTTTTQSASDNSTKIATTAYVDAAVAAGGGGGGSVIPSTNDFRFSVSNGVYETTGDVIGATVGYLTPGNGNTICTRDAGTWAAHQSSQISLAIPSDAYRIFDRYVYFNGSTLALEDTPWDASRTTGSITGATAALPCVLTSTNSLSVGDYIAVDGITGTLGTDTAAGLNTKKFRVSAVSGSTITLEGQDTTGLTYTSGGTWYKIPVSPSTAPVQQDGVWCKTGALDRRWIGRFMTLAAGTTEDSAARCLVDNVDNARTRPSSCTLNSGTFSYTTYAWRPFCANTNAGSTRIEAVQCFSKTTSFRNYQGFTGLGGANYSSRLALNNVTTPLTPSAGVETVTAGNGTLAFNLNETSIAIPAGFAFIQRIELEGYSGGTAYIVCDPSSAGAPGLANGLYGSVSH